MNTYPISGRTPEFTGSQRGLVVVELAITLPLIVLIMFATAEIGRAFFQYTTLTKAVEAGTRYYAASADPTSQTAKDTAIDLIACGRPTCADDDKPTLPGISVSELLVDGDHVVVTATYGFKPMLGAILPIVGKKIFGENGFTMTASHEMRAL